MSRKFRSAKTADESSLIGLRKQILKCLQCFHIWVNFLDEFQDFHEITQGFASEMGIFKIVNSAGER